MKLEALFKKMKQYKFMMAGREWIVCLNDKDVKYVYYPHVENKIKGVSYIEDSWLI